MFSRIIRTFFPLFVLTLSLVFPIKAAIAEFSNPKIMDGFPYAGKPFHAATTFAIARIADGEELKDSRIILKPERTSMEGFDRQPGFQFLYGMQRSSADLVFVVPGFGSTGMETSVEVIAKAFFDAGYNVATLPSPLSWSFARHISESAIVGNFEVDSKELFRAAKAVQAKLEDRGMRVGKVRFVGYSYGGLTVSHMHRQNYDGKLMPNVVRYTAVNPPIDMNHAMNTLQSFVNITGSRSRQEWKGIYDWVWGKFFDKLTRQELSEDYYYSLNGVERVKEDIVKFLIQYSFRDSQKSVIFVANQINDLGLIPRATNGRRDPAYVAAARWTFVDYVEKLLPLAFPSDTRNPRDLMESQSLTTAIEGLDNSKFTVMHTRNDFLVTAADLEALRAQLDRSNGSMVLIDDGGHMGTYWWPAWQAELVKAATR